MRDGREQPLIPRYFDLLVYLIEHRHEAVHRRDIFDHVWNDVVVSDSALSQAIRTIRRTLGDDSREPRFIRTISRHGYRFVFDGVVEEPDGLSPVETAALKGPPYTSSAGLLDRRSPGEGGSGPRSDDAFEPLLLRITDASTDDDES